MAEVKRPVGRPRKDRSNEPPKEKRKVGRPRKNGLERDTSSFIVPENKPVFLPDKLKEKTSTYQIYMMLLNGWKRDEIAEELNMTPQNVSILMSKVMADLDAETKEMAMHFVSVTYARAERFIRPLMKEADNAILEERVPDSRVVSSFKEMAKLQADVLGIGTAMNSGQQANQINNYYQPTLNANSPLYAEALANEQQLIAGTVMPKFEELAGRDNDVIILDNILEDGIEIVSSPTTQD